MKSKLLRTAASFAVVAVLASACGSSSSSSTPTTAPPTSAATGSSPTSAATGGNQGPATGAPIVIGTMCSCTGPLQSVYSPIPKSNTAWVDYTNAHGGINGHPVKLDYFDDQDSATLALQGYHQLVDQDHVKALVGVQSTQTEAWRKLAEAAGIPVIGGTSSEPGMYSSSDFFPTGANYFAATYLTGLAAKQQGLTKMAILVCAEAPVCAGFLAPMKAQLKVMGSKVAYGAAVLATATDYTSNCLAAKQAGADYLLSTVVSSAALRILTNCQQQGVNLKNFSILSDTTPALIASKAGQGTFVVDMALSIVDTLTPGGRLMQAALTQYSPSVRSDPDFTNVVSLSFAGFEMFRAAAVAGHFGPTSPVSDLFTGLYSLKNANAGGLAPPVTYVKGKPTLVSCGFQEKVVNYKLVELNNAQPTCVPAAQLKPFYASWGITVP